MDAQGRGRAENIDPADQWVLNPETGDYELRLSPSDGRPPGNGRRGSVPRSRQAPDRERPRRGPGEDRPRRPAPPQDRESGRGREREDDAELRPSRETVPGQRRRRGAEDGPPPGRAASRRAGGRKGRGQKQKKGGKKKVLLWTGGVLAFVMVALAASAYAYLEHLKDNINSVADDGAGTGGFSKDRAINVLLIGTDKRSGEGNEGYGDKDSPGHADTTFILHVSKDRSNATALSIPRDLITDIPDCPTQQEDGTETVIPGQQNTKFNESLGQSERTPSCTMRTVTELTGIKMDHFMVADFNAVKTLSTAVGGVEVCLAKDIDDPDSHLKLSKGTHTIEGEEALAFVRTRHSVGFGGDLSRIEIQQQFLSSLMRKLSSNDTLTSPTKMFSLAEAGTKALTVDSTLADISKLRDLGMELGKLDPKNLTFTTIPVVDNPAETVKATVVLDERKAQTVFQMVREDVSFTAVKKKEKKEKAAVAARLKGERADASEVRVDVYNGGAATGSAQTTLTWLQNTQGVLKSTQLGNAPGELAKTTVEYGEDEAPQARKLADLMGLPASALKPGESVSNSQGLPAVKLTLGRDFKGAGIPLVAPKEAPKDVKKVSADKTVCAK
ncbi:MULTISPECIES: LCP family protein [Streptomyces]|uniref:LytR family transcriptional regulator n=1 Tax=Streptomyces gougerotii TaxID=53448 RepID=A0A8H9LT71_9ACTN|nr:MULTISPECIES: LCP family protein [Streptomyces]MBL3804790.1 LCP family protein [Streptomyces sp. BRB081]GFH63820.1 LytR family transcriptional regulator [Streptomyces rutgersensis]GFH75534.1 LytR family transcriptional regulator [Streptomyces gougerotii]GGU88832.1 LytR family transcriptional regulator [Streptomyces gougerotii]